MKRIFIVGIVASGKTTLAKKLSDKLGVSWYELDCIVHHETPAGRYKRTADEQVQVIKEIDRSGPWIFEGTDRESYQCLYEMADIVIWMDTPLWRRKTRILVRFLKQKFGLEKCHYKPDLTMLRLMYRWTRDFERKRGQFEAKLRGYEDKVVRVRDAKNLAAAVQRLGVPREVW